MSVRKRTSTPHIMYLTAIALLAGGVFAPQAIADDEHDQCIEASDGTNAAWSACGGAYLARVNAQMEEAWQRVFPELTPMGQTLIEAEQQAWRSFKDLSCLYYENGEYGRGGQVLHFSICRGEIIENRTRYLDELIAFVSVEGE